MFRVAKGMDTKKANLIFPLYPQMVLELAMPNCLKANDDHDQKALSGHCGYDQEGLRTNVFVDLARSD